MPFTRQIVAAGDGSLVIDQIKSPGYNAATGAGWFIGKDGSASFGSVYADNLLISPTSISSPSSPQLHLASLMRLWGEISIPINNGISAQYDTTTTHTDPNFGTIVLPSSSNFTPGNGSVNFLVTANLNVFSGGTIPAGQFMFQLFNNGVAINPDYRLVLDINDRGEFSKSWLVTVGYVAGVPQSTLTCQAWQSAAGNPYHMSGGCNITVIGFPKFDTFVS